MNIMDDEEFDRMVRETFIRKIDERRGRELTRAEVDGAAPEAAPPLVGLHAKLDAILDGLSVLSRELTGRHMQFLFREEGKRIGMYFDGDIASFRPGEASPAASCPPASPAEHSSTPE